MGIRDDFANFIDGNNLNTPAPCVPISGQNGSDNGPMFTSEYYIMLKKNGQLTEQDKLDYAQKIGQCIGPEGLLNRVPVSQNDGIEGPDDYYGTLNGCIELGNTKIPRKLLWACVKFKGSLDNVSPGKWQWQTFLIRQPQLLATMVSASFPSLKNPLHWLVRLLFCPFFLFSATIIATSCMGTPIDQADPRRLAWHLQNNTKKVSPFCYLASLIWMWRLKKDYGSDMMKAVASEYYEPNGENPYSKWWVT
jgi:hypothetical protein